MSPWDPGADGTEGGAALFDLKEGFYGGFTNRFYNGFENNSRSKLNH